MTNKPELTEAMIEDKALAIFTEYFVRNYPGPHTIIGDPYWHAPKIFRAAEHAMEAARIPPVTEPSEASGDSDIVERCRERARDAWEAPDGAVAETFMQAADHILAQDARIAELEEGLEPFVGHYEKWMDEWPDDADTSTFSRVSFGQLRKARALIKKGSETSQSEGG